MIVFISKSSPIKNIIYAKCPPHRVILSGANDSVNRLRSRTRRKEGDANGIRISVEHKDWRIARDPALRCRANARFDYAKVAL